MEIERKFLIKSLPDNLESSGIHFHRTRYPCQAKKRRLYSHPEVCWITRQRRN